MSHAHLDILVDVPLIRLIRLKSSTEAHLILARFKRI
jgi:hypothetical protein